VSLRHRLSPVAERDVAEIVEYLAKANLDAAIAFIDQLSDRFRQLEQYPESGAQFADPQRRLRRTSLGNYVIVYQYSTTPS
jgi:plasmid stabilization system protein ParE